MKKSEIYRLAQIAVLNHPVSDSVKLAVLKELSAAEDLALFTESQEKENADATV